jgi:hypothetical protein
MASDLVVGLCAAISVAFVVLDLVLIRRHQ